MTMGGIETMVLNIVNEQTKYHKIFLVVINNLIEPSLIEKLDNKVELILIKRPVSDKNPFYLFKLNYSLLKIAPDIIHCHCPSMVRFIFLSFFKEKICVTQHSLLDPRYIKYIDRFKYRFAISDAVKENMKHLTGLDSDVVLNGVNLDLIKSKHTSNLSDKFKIVILSRLEHQIKGQHIAIEAFDILMKKGFDNIHLYLIGEGNSENYLKEMTKKMSLEKDVSFLGIKTQDYIFSHLYEYDLLIQPSIYEGFGLTVAEAMAAKVPVLVSENDGPLEIIDNGNYGYFFRKNDSVSCAEIIEKILNDPNKYELAEKAYRRVKEKYDVKVTAHTYIKKYKEILSRKK
jgi:glycosyltransferase involved in cell wall biosynthesis